MDFTSLVSALESIPTWVWVVGGIVTFMALTGQRILWDYEVKFPLKEGIGRGKVEFECGSKKGSEIEYHFQLEPLYKEKPIHIFLNGIKMHTVPVTPDKPSGTQAVKMDEPNEGDTVTVEVDGKEIFSGQLVLD